MKICESKAPNTFMILEGIYCTFQIQFVMDFVGFKFQVDVNVSEKIIRDVC